MNEITLANRGPKPIEIVIEPYPEYIDLGVDKEAIVRNSNSKLRIEHHIDMLVIYEEAEDNIEVYLGTELVYKTDR